MRNQILPVLEDIRHRRTEDACTLAFGQSVAIPLMRLGPVFLPITDADSPAADGSIFLITDSRSTDLELPTQSALHGVKLPLCVNNSFALNQNCFLGVPTPPISHENTR